MSGLETAIRHALDRSDRTSAETRARIYQSARNALEAGLRKQDVHDPDIVSQQRHRLEVIIHGIETQERIALKTAALVSQPLPEQETAARREPQPPLGDAHELSARRDPQTDDRTSVEGGLDTLRPERFDAPRHDDPIPSGSIHDEARFGRVYGGPSVARAEARSDRAALKAASGKARPAKRRRGRFFSWALVAATLIAASGTAAWWAQTSGLMKSASERDTSVANPPATVQSEDFDGQAGLTTLANQSGFSGDWIEVFTPDQAGKVVPSPRATAQTISDESGARIRIASATSASDGDVSIEIPVSLLEQLSGKTSTVALTVRSGTDKPTQFSVECAFSSLGDCGRHRFTVNDEKADMLFKVTYDRSLAPSEPGRIMINSDVTGGGKSLGLFAIRVLPGQ